MRKYQLTINLDCFDAPGKKKTFSVYTDANSVWEVLCSGVRILIERLTKDGYTMPFVGAATSYVKLEEI